MIAYNIPLIDAIAIWPFHSHPSSLRIQTLAIYLRSSLPEIRVLRQTKRAYNCHQFKLLYSYLFHILIHQTSNYIMNDSCASREEPKIHNLEIDLEGKQTEWKNQDFQRSETISLDDFSSEMNRSNSRSFAFRDEIKQDSIIKTPQILRGNSGSETGAQCALLQQVNENNDLLDNSKIVKAKIPSQMTITLLQQSQKNKFYDSITTDDNSYSISLKTFLNQNNRSYHPHIICLKFLFNKLKEYSLNSLNNLKNYIDYFKIKFKQICCNKIEYYQLNSTQAEDEINMDIRTVCKVLRKDYSKKEQRKIVFFETMKQIIEELEDCHESISSQRKQRQQYIEQQIINKMDRIESQINSIIKSCLQSGQKTSGLNCQYKSDFTKKDKYLEMKYLMRREDIYLKLIQEFNNNIITYVNTFFITEEVEIINNIEDALIDYILTYVQTYGHSTLQQSLDHFKKQTDQEINNQLFHAFVGIIPQELYNLKQRNPNILKSANLLEAIITDFSDCLQNTIFFTSIEMNSELILFKSEAAWKCNNESRQNSLNMIFDYESNANKSKANEKIFIVAVLTSNYYLHLEQEDKIATIKIGEVKMSRKGREIILFDKLLGISGLLGFRNEIGRIQFGTAQQTDLFSEKLAFALRKLS